MLATGPGSIPWFFVTELFAQSGIHLSSYIYVCYHAPCRPTNCNLDCSRRQLDGKLPCWSWIPPHEGEFFKLGFFGGWSPQSSFFSFVCLVVVIALVLVAVAQHPLFQLLMGPWVFMVFIVIQLFFIIYVAIVVPETKGRQIDEITALFRK